MVEDYIEKVLIPVKQIIRNWYISIWVLIFLVLISLITCMKFDIKGNIEFDVKYEQPFEYFKK